MHLLLVFLNTLTFTDAIKFTDQSEQVTFVKENVNFNH